MLKDHLFKGIYITDRENVYVRNPSDSNTHLVFYEKHSDEEIKLTTLHDIFITDLSFWSLILLSDDRKEQIKKKDKKNYIVIDGLESFYVDNYNVSNESEYTKTTKEFDKFLIEKFLNDNIVKTEEEKKTLSNEYNDYIRKLRSYISLPDNSTNRTTYSFESSGDVIKTVIKTGKTTVGKICLFDLSQHDSNDPKSKIMDFREFESFVNNSRLVKGSEKLAKRLLSKGRDIGTQITNRLKMLKNGSKAITSSDTSSDMPLPTETTSWTHK